MKRKPLTGELMNEILAGKSGAAPVAAAPLDGGKMVRMNFFIPEGWKNALGRHFKPQGLDLSSGIRQLLSRYINERGLR